MSPAGRRTDGAVRIPAGLTGPVDVVLARAVEEIPGPNDLVGGSQYEPKDDGFRAIIVRSGDEARLWSRNGKDLTVHFPDIAAAAASQLEEGVVLDGELVIMLNGRLSFDALQRRLVTGRAKASVLAKQMPALYVAFDLLARGGVDLRTQRWRGRRSALSELAIKWKLLLQLTPVTDDVVEARQWYDVLPSAIGVEGLVVKGAGTRYVGGSRAWLKVNSDGVCHVRLLARLVLYLVSISCAVRQSCATGVAHTW